jgi:uncharacterized protein (DUF2132 family)
VKTANLTYFWFIACHRCQISCHQSSAIVSKQLNFLEKVHTARTSLCSSLNVRTWLSLSSRLHLTVKKGKALLVTGREGP